MGAGGVGGVGSACAGGAVGQLDLGGEGAVVVGVDGLPDVGAGGGADVAVVEFDGDLRAGAVGVLPAGALEGDGSTDGRGALDGGGRLARGGRRAGRARRRGRRRSGVGRLRGDLPHPRVDLPVERVGRAVRHDHVVRGIADGHLTDPVSVVGVEHQHGRTAERGAVHQAGLRIDRHVEHGLRAAHGVGHLPGGQIHGADVLRVLAGDIGQPTTAVDRDTGGALAAGLGHHAGVGRQRVELDQGAVVEVHRVQQRRVGVGHQVEAHRREAATEPDRVDHAQCLGADLGDRTAVRVAHVGDVAERVDGDVARVPDVTDRGHPGAGRLVVDDHRVLTGRAGPDPVVLVVHRDAVGGLGAGVGRAGVERPRSDLTDHLQVGRVDLADRRDVGAGSAAVPVVRGRGHPEPVVPGRVGRLVVLLADRCADHVEGSPADLHRGRTRQR